MFGPYILVAPILYEDQNERDVYLPSGTTWTLLMNGEVYEGGQTLHVTAPLIPSKYPVLGNHKTLDA